MKTYSKEYVSQLQKQYEEKMHIEKWSMGIAGFFLGALLGPWIAQVVPW